jgi:hypothetical protein
VSKSQTAGKGICLATWVQLNGRSFSTGLFVPKPSSRVSTLGNPVSNLGLSVRQRLLVCVGVHGDRHSVSHPAVGWLLLLLSPLLSASVA